MTTASPAGDGLTGDRILGGRLSLVQTSDGYRAGMDAILLASAIRLAPGARAAEFGCGPGAALLCAAHACPDAHITGVELDPRAADLARRNAAANGMEDRITIVEGDALTWRPGAALDAVFFNPPFFDDPQALRAPKPGKTAAWISEAPLADWISAGLKRLKSGGSLTLIHRADRLGEALTALQGRASMVVLPVHPRAGAPAKRILIEARAGGRAPLALLPPLVLHEDGSGAWTARADALLRGQARLEMRA
ncbi:methyltransferase [Alkalicaulis satelles]|uniref:Methyltransferase n=1 Tax=Alkalicaulis satelles TaxID=2609175 RepID=A0A5M6ZE45_9PROT|nr:methyltransferase [Alkalicaulis satelles]KAA5802164.1 methyltransferase [Alkalicaulis satelles]